jgi:Flp pilus assembly pilin Flp
MERLKKFLKEEDGVAPINYMLIAAIIVLGILISRNDPSRPASYLTDIFTAVAGLWRWAAGQLGSLEGHP